MKAAPDAVKAGVIATNVVWRADLITITPLSGSVIRWTTLDLAMVVGGHTYEPGPILRRSLRQGVVPEIDSYEATLVGSFDLGGTPLARLALDGYFDDATITVDHAVMPSPGDISWGVINSWFAGTISTVEPSSGEFKLTAKGALEALNALQLPRFLFQPSCGHVVFDVNCGLTRASFTTSGTVSGTPTTRTFGSDVTGQANGYYNLGVVTFTSGALAGTRTAIRSYVQSGGAFTLEFPLLSAPQAGDTFSVYPGCARTWAACRDKFNNVAHFRGFTEIPLPAGGLTDTPLVPPKSGGGTSYARTGPPVPIVYGTVKVAANIIERNAPVNIGPGLARRLPSTAYVLGDCREISTVDSRHIGGFFYGMCIQSGRSSSSPSIPRVYSGTTYADGTVTWLVMNPGYRQTAVYALCEGPIAGVGRVWQDRNSLIGLSALDHNYDWLNLLSGSASQSRPVWSVGDNPYGYTACVFLDNYTGASNQPASLDVEVQGLFCSPVHASPPDILTDLMTHARRGAGLPSSSLDAAGLTAWRTYCTAVGLGISWAITSQSSALDLIAQLLKGGNAAAVWSSGALKVVPLSDEAVGSYSPSTTPAYDLGPDDMLEPMTSTRKSPAECYNSIPVQYTTAVRYQDDVVDNPDMADVDRRGRHWASPEGLPFILDPSVATMLARIYTQRSLNVRMTYQFKVASRYLLLEPTDVVTLTDSLSEIDRRPARVVAVEETLEQGQATLDLTLEDWPIGVASAAAYTPQSGDGYEPNLVNPLNGLIVSSGMVPGGTLSDLHLTRSNFDNLFPNPTSEQLPPDGADLTAPEWAALYQPSSGAYSGSRVRRLTRDGTNEVDVLVACSPGEKFYFESQCRKVGTSQGCWLEMRFFDKDGTTIVSGTEYASTTSGTWTKLSIVGTAPANAIGVSFQLQLLYVLNDGEAWFDALYARRVIDSSVLGDESVYSQHVAPLSWTAISPAANWTVNGAQHAANILKEVVLVGTMSNTTTGSLLMATLPAAARPSRPTVLIVYASGGTPDPDIYAVQVGTDGTMTIMNKYPTQTGLTFNLDGLKYIL